MSNEYDDIINLPHHISKKHPQMSLEQRSAQFAPFSALSGYDDIVEEAGRLTDSRVEVSDEIKSNLDLEFQKLIGIVKLEPKVYFSYFVPDNKKDGGSYRQITTIVKKVDIDNRFIIFADNSSIRIDDIVEMKIIENNS